MRDQLIFHAVRQFYNNKIELHAAFKQENGDLAIFQPPVLDRIEAGLAYFQRPFIAMAHEEAQRLVDELWLAGIRPSEGTGSAGSLAATERHLKDMQRIVFKGFTNGE